MVGKTDVGKTGYTHYDDYDDFNDDEMQTHLVSSPQHIDFCKREKL